MSTFGSKTKRSKRCSTHERHDKQVLGREVVVQSVWKRRKKGHGNSWVYLALLARVCWHKQSTRNKISNMAQRQYAPDPNDSIRAGVPGRSGIPMPSSAMKSTNYLQQSVNSNPGGSGMRASLAPSARPASRAAGPRKSNFGAPVAVTRGAPPGASSSRGGGGAGPSSSQQALLSASQAWDHARTPMKQSTAQNNFATSAAAGSVNRRSTVGGGLAASASRQSRVGPATAGPRGGGQVRDSRPTRDAQWQKMAQMQIYEYLMEVKSDMELSFLTPAVLRSPTSKQFEEIWKFLVMELDPDWVPENPKVQEEFVPVMKDLQYPFAETITKSSLSAINSPHSWAAITAALHWMVQQARVRFIVTILPGISHSRSIVIRLREVGCTTIRPIST